METCWFCNTNQATHKFKVFLFKNTLTSVTANEKRFLVSNITVDIQRCNLCANVHQFRDKRKKMYLVTFLLNVVLFFFLAVLFAEQISSIFEKLDKVIGFIILMFVVVSPTIIILGLGLIRRKKAEIIKYKKL